MPVQSHRYFLLMLTPSGLPIVAHVSQLSAYRTRTKLMADSRFNTRIETMTTRSQLWFLRRQSHLLIHMGTEKSCQDFFIETDSF